MVVSVQYSYKFHRRKNTRKTDTSDKNIYLNVEKIDEWISYAAWSLEEAIYLSCGIEPNTESKSSKNSFGITRKKAISGYSKYVVSENSEIAEIRNRVRRAKSVAKLTDPVEPKIYLRWLHKSSPAAHIFTILKEKSDEYDDNAAKHHQPQSPHELSGETNRVGTVYKILIAMALKFTKYNDENSASSLKKIEDVMMEYGLAIDHKSLKLHMQNAYQKHIDKIRKAKNNEMGNM